MDRAATNPDASGGAPASDAKTLAIEITKRTDGGTLLRCVRPDGTNTWQRSENRQAAFFPLHDLTHYAVESVLRTKFGFFGLIADGWAIDDTTGKGSMGPLHPEAKAVEHLVGLLDVQRATGSMWTAEEFNAQLAAAGIDIALLDLTADKLKGICDRRRELFAAWAAVEDGKSLDLTFPPGL